MSHRLWILFITITLTSTVLAGCSQPDPTPEPPTFVPTREPVDLPTDTAEPTRTIAPPIIVTSPISSPEAAEPQPTATIETVPSPTAITLLEVGDFGDNRNPLTGEIMEDPEVLNRLPLAVKISNAPPAWVRPQSGLNDADLVFEHVTEARITRFTMVVYGKTPPDVGPIRSARLIDLEIPAMYSSALVYSGSSEGVRRKLFNSDFWPRILLGGDGYYRTGANKPFEHTLYAKPDLLWASLEERGLNQAPTFQNTMAFSSDTPTGGEPASEVIIDYDWTLINWRYDIESGRYLRWTDGEPHLDANNDQQVNAANVVVILADHYDDTSICEQVINGVCTAYSLQPVLNGSGDAIIFRDGQRYSGTWHRDNRQDLLTFTGSDGETLPLQLGNTWFQVIPIYYQNPVASTP